ncbi:MAG: hypothetical protein ACI4JM_04435, partial [Oscillospiraceae bacterium]
MEIKISKLWLVWNFIIPVQRTAFAQTFFGKSLTKNFLERPLGRGLCPHTPVSLQAATKGFAFGNHKLLKKLDQ